VRQLGGLHVIGTERHEARRIDNQLRGRAGRQGDPGSSRFYVALDDELMRIFGGERVAAWMDRLRIDEDTPIEHALVTRQIEAAQKKVEQYHFDIRKHVLEYDDVMNVQRKVIYAERRKVLQGEQLRENVVDMIERLMADLVATYCPKGVPRDEWDLEGLREAAAALAPPLAALPLDELRGTAEEVEERLVARALEAYEAKEREVGPEAMREIERLVLLQVIDRKWIDHLQRMDHLREGIGLRAYAQVSPLIEYQREGYELFQAMLRDIQEETLRLLYRVQVEPGAPAPAPVRREPALVTNRPPGGGGAPAARPRSPGGGSGRKLGRNDPCWCGSGKKYKKCHGREA
jgi:preprotein translocase subunit SecA